MKQLIALVFDDPYKGEEARAALHRMAGEGLLEIGETALIVKHEDAKTRISQDTDMVAKDQHVGHLVGLVAGALTGMTPFILAGTLAGRLIGNLKDNGVTNKFLKEVGKEIQPGTSALILLASSDPERRLKIAERLRDSGPKILESDLPPEVEQELAEALQKQHTRTSGA
jgi:uncharacterized membrane protein